MSRWDASNPGDQAPNAPKWFAAVEMIQLATDQDWLHKATAAQAAGLVRWAELQIDSRGQRRVYFEED